MLSKITTSKSFLLAATQSIKVNNDAALFRHVGLPPAEGLHPRVSRNQGSSCGSGATSINSLVRKRLGDSVRRKVIVSQSEVVNIGPREDEGRGRLCGCGSVCCGRDFHPQDQAAFL